MAWLGIWHSIWPFCTADYKSQGLQTTPLPASSTSHHFSSPNFHFQMTLSGYELWVERFQPLLRGWCWWRSQHIHSSQSQQYSADSPRHSHILEVSLSLPKKCLLCTGRWWRLKGGTAVLRTNERRKIKRLWLQWDIIRRWKMKNGKSFLH